jgi:sodium-dependent phosphate cotransporter
MTSWVTLRVASNQIPLKSSFGFILGANIGTTITALLATIGLSNISIQIAMAHILFNVLGVALLYILPFLRNYLIVLARYCGHQVAEKRILGVLGILLVFFIIPFLLIYFN